MGGKVQIFGCGCSWSVDFLRHEDEDDDQKDWNDHTQQTVYFRSAGTPANQTPKYGEQDGDYYDDSASTHGGRCIVLGRCQPQQSAYPQQHLHLNLNIVYYIMIESNGRYKDIPFTIITLLLILLTLILALSSFNLNQLQQLSMPRTSKG